ncbi:DUF998 domain-containing protein [Streptosporangium carneum]|uniref:DUF998 domain-containing protein n=1 Tax=Streptosporangium carneum TaxID=47481 RepID=UPI0022F2E17D|nr:DUF998 domain-containing protein [Streptosporangium carneum]
MNESPVIGNALAGGAPGGGVASTGVAGTGVAGTGVAGTGVASMGGAGRAVAGRAGADGGFAGGDAVWRWPGVAGALLAVAATAYAHLAAGGLVDPMRTLISDYALLDGSALAMICGTITLAMGSVWVAYGLARVDPARSAAARVLFLAGALGLLLTAAFTTDAAPDVVSAGGEIHRWSAAVVFTALPCAGWMLGRRFGSPALTAVSALSVALLATFLAAHPGSLVSPLIDGPDYYGLVQRLLVLSDTALVLLAALTLNRGIRGGGEGRGDRVLLFHRDAGGRPAGGAATPAMFTGVTRSSKTPIDDVSASSLPMGMGPA